MGILTRGDPVDAFLARFPSEDIRREGDGWKVRCPGHADDSPSLHVNRGRNGGVLLHDFGGCSTDAIIRALGIHRYDLMPERMMWLAPGPKGVVYEHHRINPRGGGKKKMYWRTQDGGKGIGGAGVDNLALYCADRLPANMDETIILVEGEANADLLRYNGFPAVATVTGSSGTPSTEVLRALEGRPVTLWPDFDDVGRRHMQRIADRLRGVRWILWGEHPKDDATDFFTRGGDAEQLDRMLVDALEEGPARSTGPVPADEPEPETEDPEPEPEPETEDPEPEPEKSVAVAVTVDASPGLVVVGARDFASRVFPPRDILLAPFFEAKNLGMVYANRGTGKTIVSVGIALAVSAGGTFLRWNAPKARRVLYVDGELPQETLQKRINDVARTTGLEVTDELRLLTPDTQPEGVRIPDLATPEGQKRFLDLIDVEAPSLVIFDNLSTLVRGGAENDAESWQPIQDFLILLRSRGYSVLLVHHTDKVRGDQRGTSKREDVLDWSLKLARPESYVMEEGARFEVHFTKARDLVGGSVAPFEARMEAESWALMDISTEAKARREEEKQDNRLRAIADEIEALLKKGAPLTFNRILENVTGKKENVRDALRGLKAQGVADFDPGPNRAQLWRWVGPSPLGGSLD